MLSIDRKILDKILDDQAFVREAVSLLGAMIDNEMEKDEDEMDCDLISECSSLLTEIESGMLTPYAFAERLASSDQMIKAAGKLKSRGVHNAVKVMLVAAVLLASAVSVYAVSHSVSEEARKETTSVTAVSTVTSEETSVDGNETTVQTSAALSLTDDSVVVQQAETEKEDGLCVYKTAYAPYSKGKRVPYLKKGDSIQINYVPDPYANENFKEEKYVKEWYGNTDYCEVAEDHQHRFTPWEVTKQPTCGGLGEKRCRCTVCEREYIYPIAATGEHHFAFEGTVNRATRESKTGTALMKCKNCDTYWHQEYEFPTTVVLDRDTYTFDGKNHTPKVLAVLDSKGYEISPEEYTVNYAVFDQNKEGYSVTQCHGLFVEFTDSPYYQGELEVNYAVTPPAVRMEGVKADASSLTPYWKDSALFHDEYNDDCLKGFEIQVSDAKDFSSAKTVKVKNISARYHSVSGLTGGKTYYVRMRVYAYDYRREYNTYGPWSEVREVILQ